MQKLEIKIAKSAEIRRLVTINWRYSITEQQWTAYSDSPTLTRYFMRSVNTNKNENFFSHENNALFNIQISSDGKCYERRYANEFFELRKNETEHTHKRTNVRKQKRLMKIFYSCDKNSFGLKYDTTGIVISNSPPPSQKKKKKKFKATNGILHDISKWNIVGMELNSSWTLVRKLQIFMQMQKFCIAYILHILHKYQSM